MAPPPHPSAIDHFFAHNQNPILMGAFATQLLHHQYIRITQPAIEPRITFPRYLRAGLGWGMVFVGLLTKITLAKKAVRDYSDPIVSLASQRRPWKAPIKEGL